MKTRKSVTSRSAAMPANHMATAVALALATVVHAHGATRTWDGNGSTNDWGEVNLNPLGGLLQNTNWTDNSVVPLPISGDTLIFAGTRRLDANNDLDGLTIAGITFQQGAGSFTLQGNALRSTGDILNRSNVHQRVSLPVELGVQHQTWDGGSAGMTFSKSVTIGAHSLTLTNGVVIENAETAHAVTGNLVDHTLRVTGGSRVTSAGLTLGSSSGSGALIVSGAGSKWLGTGDFATAAGARGTLVIEQGGTVEGRNATLAVEGPAPFYSGRLSQGGRGEVTVDGPGSRWSLTGRLDLGVNGTGTLHVTNGGRVETADARLGVATGDFLEGTNGRGTAVVDGIGSVWNNAGALVVGVSGWGRLTVQAGGLVSTRSSTIGAFLGRITVTGGGSRLVVAQTMEVGGIGAGSLEVLAGGTVTSAHAYVGHTGGGSDTVARVSGAGSSWNVAGQLAVGEGTAGSLVVTDGGVVVSGTGVVGHKVLRFLQPGTPGAGNVTLTGAGSAWTVAGAVDVGISDPGTITLSDGARLASRSTRLGVSQVVAVPGTPFRSIYRGSGAVSLAGAGTHWQVEGPLAIGDKYSTGALTVSDGARVEVDGGVHVARGTIELAGASLRATDLDFGGASTLRIRIADATPRAPLDLVDASGIARLDGTLEVVFMDGPGPVIGTSFVVLTFGQHLGQFAMLDVTGLGDGLRLFATYGAHDLTLTVAPVPEPHTYAMLLAGLACCAAARRRAASRRGRSVVRQ